MSKVVKILKVAVKIVIGIALALLIIILLLDNRSLRKDHEKQQNTIKNYEQKFFGTEASEEVIQETEQEVTSEKELEYSSEEIQKIIYRIYAVEKRVEALENAKKNSETTAETVDVDVEESIKSFLSRKFPFNGSYYKEAGECQYYSDTFCTQKLDSQNLRFISQITDYAVAENGLSVTCLLTDDWQIVYCTQSPYLITETEYDEIHYQK